jgi:hypothetical protein
MNNVIKKAKFLILPESSNDKVFIKANFPIGQTFSREQVIMKMKSFYETKSMGGISSLMENKKGKELMKEFKIMVQSKPQRNDKLKGEKEKFTIEGYNTLGIEPIQLLPERSFFPTKKTSSRG